MTPQRTFAALLLITVLTAWTGASLFAFTPEDKLKRGASNIWHSWHEIPANMHRETDQVDVFEGLTTGLFYGLGRAIARAGVGIYEVVTFLIPLPENHEPIINRFGVTPS